MGGTGPQMPSERGHKGEDTTRRPRRGLRRSQPGATLTSDMWPAEQRWKLSTAYATRHGTSCLISFPASETPRDLNPK